MPFTVKQILLDLSLAFTAPAALQLLNSISSDLQKLLKYFNGTAIVAFLKILLVWFGAGWTPVFSNNLATVFPNNLALYFKDLKLSVFAISAL